MDLYHYSSHTHPVYRRDNNGDLIVDGRGNNIFDCANNSQILNGTCPQLNNENVYGALFNYKIEK
jgi:hypothetical protein